LSALWCCRGLLQVLSQLSQQGIAVRIATKKLAAEEAPESYKDVSQVRSHLHS
jgi:RNA-splicing ligase RtcB